MKHNRSGETIVNIKHGPVLEDAGDDRLASGSRFCSANSIWNHLVKTARDPDFRATVRYKAQDLIRGDGIPSSCLSRLARKPGETMPGSDWWCALCCPCSEKSPGQSVALAQAGTDDKPASRLRIPFRDSPSLCAPALCCMPYCPLFELWTPQGTP